MFILQRVNFRVPSHDWPHPFLTTPTPKIPFNLHEFVSACKKSVNSRDTVNFRAQRPVCSICYGEIVHLEIMQYDLLRVFWPTSQEQDFSQTGFVQEHSK